MLRTCSVIKLSCLKLSVQIAMQIILLNILEKDIFSFYGDLNLINCQSMLGYRICVLDLLIPKLNRYLSRSMHVE